MRQFFQPRWLAAHIFVLAVCVGCLLAGFWQLDRLEERRLSNAVNQARYGDDPMPIEDLVAAAGPDLQSLEYRRATATGRYLPEDEVLIRSQVLHGQAGFDVVTPLALTDGRAVAVNRGWVPLEFDTVPVTAAPPPAGEVTVEGVIRVTPDRSTAATSEDGRATTLSRVDISVLDRQSQHAFLPVYVEVIGSGDATTLPVPAELPDFSDEGPHLGYAIQWFSFALVGAVGYGLLLRRARRRSDRDGELVNDLDPGEPDEVAT